MRRPDCEASRFSRHITIRIMLFKLGDNRQNAEVFWSASYGTDLLMTADGSDDPLPANFVRSIMRLVQPTTGSTEQRLPRP